METQLGKLSLGLGISLVWLLFFGMSQNSHAAEATREHEYIEEVEKDYALRQFKPLRITNVRGDISVQGWSLDKLRIKFRKRVVSSSPIQATQLLSTMDYRYSPNESSLEISSQYGKDLSIAERIKEKENPKVRLEIVVYAPSHLKLNVWGVDGSLILKNWGGLAELRSHSGLVRVENFKGEAVSVTCESCSAQYKTVRGSIRSSTGKGAVELSQVEGRNIYVETLDGAIQLFEVVGDQLYTSRQGSIQGRFLKGKVEFHAEDSKVSLSELDGFLSGYLEKGSLQAQVKSWKPTDQAMIETLAADVDLTFPRLFSASVDVWSKQGSSEIRLPLVQEADLPMSGPLPTGRMMGRVREGGKLLRVLSETGSIQLHSEVL